MRVVPQPMPPTKPPTGSETTLSGDWGGSRKRLYDAGVQADLVYSADYLRDTTGGLKRGGAYMGHLDLILQFDGEKLVGWRGGSAYLQLISNSGGRVNLNHVGSLMGVDNLEAPVNRTGIFKAWLQQSFLDDKASLRVGLYPIDSEFYITDSSGVFLHPSFGMAAEVASFGSLAGPSIYPTSSYARAPAYRPRSCVVRDGRGRAWNSERADRDRRPQCQLAEGHRQHADR
jgi:porin